MNRPAFHELRFWLLVAAFLLIVAGLFLPRVKFTRDAYDVIAFVDITSSMNTRDVELAGQPVSRLDLIKERLGGFVAGLPCQSKFGLGIFTTRRVFVLFEPIDVCENFSDIETAINELDWRMAWAGDSHIVRGVHDAIPLALELGADLLFFTDGHEAPPLPWQGMPEFEGEPGEVSGLLVGVGGKSLVPLLKYDDEGREVGILGVEDVAQENRSGLPPPDASSRPGWHPKWAPYGDALIDNKEHLTSVKEEHLRAIGHQTGLGYAHLDGADSLLAAFKAVARPRAVVVATDVRPYPAGLALFLLLILYGLLPLRDRMASRGIGRERLGRINHQASKLKEAHP